MIKNNLRTIWLKPLLAAVFAMVMVLQFAVQSVQASGIPVQNRTFPFDESNNIVLSEKDLAKGKKLFSNTCATCHLGGTTFTNPSVNLSPESLGGANPVRSNIVGLIDFMKNPTTYDGETEIYETHPSLRSSDIFLTMRGLTDNDLKLIAGYILYSPKAKGIGWGGGKIYY